MSRRAKTECVKCGDKNNIIVFGPEENKCWYCFKDEFLDIANNFQVIGVKERALLCWMMGIVAEKYGYEF